MKNYLLLALALGIGAQAWATSDEVTEKLLQQPHYPTVEQMLSEYSSLPTKSPFGAENRPRIASALTRGNAAHVIAAFEFAFPGATFAGLGRDAFPLVDILDAFYTSLGQPDRAKQVKASTATFTGATHEQRVALLESVGADFNPNSDAPPFVLFDCTSYSENSQSTMIVKTAYSEFMRRGGSAGDFVQRFNLVAISNSQRHSNIIEPGFDLAEFFRLQQKHARVNGRPQSILWVNATDFGYPGNGWIGGFWHNTFGSLRRLADGTVEGTPGRAADEEVRRQYLEDLADVIVVESQAKFRDQVVKEARIFGYKFPLEARAKLEPLPKKAASKPLEVRAKRALDALIKVSIYPAQGEKLGKDIIDPWFALWSSRAEDPKSLIGVHKAFLQGLKDLHDREWLSAKSFEHRVDRSLSELDAQGLLGDAIDAFGPELGWLWTTDGSSERARTLRGWIVDQAVVDGTIAPKLKQLRAAWSAKDFGILIGELIATLRGTAEFYALAMEYGIERPPITRHPTPWFKTAYRLWWQNIPRQSLSSADWVAGMVHLTLGIGNGLLPAIAADGESEVMIKDLMKRMPRGAAAGSTLKLWLTQTAKVDLKMPGGETLREHAIKRAIRAAREDGEDELRVLRSITKKADLQTAGRYIDYWLATKPSEPAVRAMIDDPMWDKNMPKSQAASVRLNLLEHWLRLSEGTVPNDERLLVVIREIATYRYSDDDLRKVGSWSVTQIAMFVASQSPSDAFYAQLMQLPQEETTGARNWDALGLVEILLRNSLRKMAHPHRVIWALRDQGMLGRIAAAQLSSARVRDRVMGRVKRSECADVLDPPAAA